MWLQIKQLTVSGQLIADASSSVEEPIILLLMMNGKD